MALAADSLALHPDAKPPISTEISDAGDERCELVDCTRFGWVQCGRAAGDYSLREPAGRSLLDRLRAASTASDAPRYRGVVEFVRFP